MNCKFSVISVLLYTKCYIVRGQRPRAIEHIGSSQYRGKIVYEVCWLLGLK